MKTSTPLAFALLLSMSFAAQAEVAFIPPAITSADLQVMANEGFGRSHPDHRWRGEAQRAYESGRYEEAITYLRRSARYADKVSQAVLGEMHWQGRGTAVDRAAAYAWMDLAAERGYRHLLAKREHYWGQLDEAERERAVEIGKRLYAEFGDDVAKPRLETVLRRAIAAKTGTRVGADIDVRVHDASTLSAIGGAHGGTIHGGGEIVGYYQPKYWQPEQYWRWQDAAHGSNPAGHVIVREMRHYGPGKSAD